MERTPMQTAELPSSPDYEAAENVPLAPIDGEDNRRQLPRYLFVKRPLLFTGKFLLAVTLIATAWVVIALRAPWYVCCGAMLVNGLIYAHLVELQHECLHGHAFASPSLNRLIGILCGVFMMSCYSHYRYDHLRHHAHLGSAANKEHFDYRFQHLGSVLGFSRSVFDMSRFARVANWTLLSLAGRHLPGIAKASYDRDIKQEYVLNFLLFAGSIAWTLSTNSLLCALAWWVPTILVSEGVHFLIEMPEHFGLNTQSDPNVFTNTRTVRTSALVSWFVNGNDIHTAHHFHQGVPMCNVRLLHRLIENKVVALEHSYRRFFWNVMTGHIKQPEATTCMLR
jgi:fatty acid desaturase